MIVAFIDDLLESILEECRAVNGSGLVIHDLYQTASELSTTIDGWLFSILWSSRVVGSDCRQ
jgi:hypothetical protein